MIRAFFAIDLEESSREAVCDVLAALRASAGGDGVRWVRREALHVTLRFLGDIEPAQVEPLARAVGSELRQRLLLNPKKKPSLRPPVSPPFIPRRPSRQGQD